MKPRIKIATTQTPDGSEVLLYQHDSDFSIVVDGQDLMHSRQHESELELARLGCAHLTKLEAPRILIGGLGMGYTLRQVLDMTGPKAEIVVCELMDAVVQWNREFMGELNGHALDDQRVKLKHDDVVQLIAGSRSNFDAILMDIDNGPNPITTQGNRRLYGRDGIRACRRALRARGCLAVWSVEPCKPFERRLVSGGLHVRRYRAAAYEGSKSLSRFVWVASEDERKLPEGGGEPLLPPRRPSHGQHRPHGRRH